MNKWLFCIFICMTFKAHAQPLGDIKNDPNGPYYHQIFSAKSTDGLRWEKNQQLIFDHASVPDAVVREGVIYLYFIDASAGHGLSVALSSDHGQTWQKHRITISNRQEMGEAVDPNPILADSGEIRLFYLGSFGPPQANGQSKTHNIYSAVSRDGIHFTEEAGVRFSYPDSITDPDVIKTDNGYKMFVALGLEALSATSLDGQTFTDDNWQVSDNGSVTKTLRFKDGWRLYKCHQGNIVTQNSGDLKYWREENLVLRADPGKIACDPGVIQLEDGSFLMFYKQAPAFH